MLWWSIQIAAISLILIFLVHHLFQFFKSTLTVPKVKDLVNGNKEEYENIQRILEQDSTMFSNNVDNYDVDQVSLLPSHDSDAMKNELKSFLKKQLKQEMQDINSFETSTSLSSLP
jgi:hypothetical protein